MLRWFDPEQKLFFPPKLYDVLVGMVSVEDQHRVDADPDPTFHPFLCRFRSGFGNSTTPSFTHNREREIFGGFYSQQCPINIVFIFLVNVIGVIIVHI